MTEIKQKILLVDADPAQLDSLRNVFQQSYTVILAASGRQALQLAETNPQPELILLDNKMPDSDGCKVCRQLKENPLTVMIPVILVIDDDEKDAGAKEISSAAADYLVRPFTADHVAAVVKVHLRLAELAKLLVKQNAVNAENIRLKKILEGFCAYDFQTPLKAVIDISTKLSRKLTMSSFQQEMLNSVGLSAGSMLDIISRSTDLYKMEKGTYQTSSIPVDLVKIIHQIFHENRGLAEKRAVKYTLNIDQNPVSFEDTFTLTCEKRLLIFMLTDLIKNAIEASPGGNEIWLNLSNSAHSTISIKFPGISFERVQELASLKSPLSESEYFSFPGLYLPRLMAKTLGGEVSHSVSASEGTTFLVSLPLAEKIRDNALTPQKDIREEVTSLSGQKSKAEIKILVVDDYAFMRQTITAILRQTGYKKIFEANDGNDAITFLESNSVDLVLCDREMPGKGGLEVLSFISGNARLKTTPFIMITACSALSELETALESGIQHYIVKPFSPEILRKKIEAVLAMSSDKEIKI